MRAALAPVLVLAAGALATPAAAGEIPGPELFAGYSFARIGAVNRHGADVALDFELLGPLSAFVDASAHWGSQSSVGRSDATLMAGPGVRFGSRGGRVLFLRALAGVVRDRSTIAILDVDISESATRLGLVAGGGVDIPVAKRLALRAQGDYQWNDAPDGESPNGFRASLGVVYRLGVIP